MTRRFLAAIILLLAFTSAIPALEDKAAAPQEIKVAALIAQLGNPLYQEREAAGRQLNEIGSAALALLHEACGSTDPEIAQRARGLVRGIEWRISNEKALAPTFVDITTENMRLGAILTELSKQSGYEIELSIKGRRPDDAVQKLTLRTGRVPFWEAVLKICDMADLQIASVSGFNANAHITPTPSAPSPPGQPVPGIAPRFAPSVNYPQPTQVGDTSKAIVLKPRGTEKKRPAVIYGGVLVEALALPPAVGGSKELCVLLQVWPEPGLQWQYTDSLKVLRAVDKSSRKMTVDVDSLMKDLPRVDASGTVKFVQNRAVNGQGNVRVIIVNGGGNFVVNGGGGVIINGVEVATSPPQTESFTPSAWQLLVKIKPGESPTDALKEISGSIFGTIRSKAEALATVELTESEVESCGLAGVKLKASLNKTKLDVTLEYNPRECRLVSTSDRLPGVKVSGTTDRNETYLGLSVTDADSRPFRLGTTLHIVDPMIGVKMRGPNEPRLCYGFQLALSPTDPNQGEPKTVKVWGYYSKPVEVPFCLKDIPLTRVSKPTRPLPPR